MLGVLSNAITVIFVSANAVRFGVTQSKVIVSRQEVSGDRSIIAAWSWAATSELCD